MYKEKMYSIAIRKRHNICDHFWDHDDYVFEEYKIDCEYRYWLADPFIFEKDGITYVFYEAFDLIESKGKIGFSIVDQNINKLKINIVIDEKYHMSFPNIFEYEGNIYMMPETCEANNVKLFRAVQFPYKWIEDKVLLDNAYACDTVFVNTNTGHNYLIACEMYKKNVPHNNYASCWVKNYCYPLDNNLNILGDKYLVAEGDFGIRNAGQVFSENGSLYRVGQNCVNRQYGKGLVMHKISSIHPYFEDMLWSLNCTDIEPHIAKLKQFSIIGVHTYNFSEHFEVIDFSQMRKPLFNTLNARRLSHLSNIMSRIVNKICKK